MTQLPSRVTIAEVMSHYRGANVQVNSQLEDVAAGLLRDAIT
jgi:hypothetical protein